MELNHVVQLKCSVCGDVFPVKGAPYICPKKHGADGNDGNLNVEYDYEVIAKMIKEDGLLPWTAGHFRYKAFMPLSRDAAFPNLTVGATPTYRAPALEKALGLREVYVKDDGRNPTASLKDRASSLLVAVAKAEGHEVITTASTGNAAAALAGCAAAMQQPCVIFVPAAAPPAKIAQMLVYGATVFLVEGTYDDAFSMCLDASERFGWYCRNTGYNAYTAEGKKTVSIELCEQLAMILEPEKCGDNRAPRFIAPDNIFVSVGDGNIITGIYKGLRDLKALGWIEKMPKLFGVQATGSKQCLHAWKNKLDPLTIPNVPSDTIADSIAAGMPRDRVNAVKSVEATGGAFVEVTDDDILVAIPEVARATGVFGEPAGVTSYAGLKKAAANRLIQKDSCTAFIITGNGLKDVAAVNASLKKVDSACATVPIGNPDLMVSAAKRFFPNLE